MPLQYLPKAAYGLIITLTLSGISSAQQSPDQQETSDTPTPPSQYLSKEGDQYDEQDEFNEQTESERKAFARSRAIQNLSAAERRQYYAGFLQGYQMGYQDSSDDVMLLLIRSQQNKPRNQSPDSMADSRLRSLLRDKMRVATGHQVQQRNEQHLRGQILSTKRITLKNTGEKHLVALVKSRHGRRRIVDLGPTRKYSDIDVEKGRTILAQGRMSRTRDEVPVLLARSVEVDGEYIYIERRDKRKSQTNQSDQ